MRMVDLIAKKRDNAEHSADEIGHIVAGYVDGSIPDYQISAWLMAVVFRGLSENETFALTDAMVESGDVLDLSGVCGFSVDKHSTGGVGDKTTLAVVPILASAGILMAKMSGRGLGHTGGTLDKLESVPGTRTVFTAKEILEQLSSVGACICAQSERLVPADRKIYALRDATGTVESLPLIAASVMSKKIAAGSSAIILDIKVGDGAFMKTVERARQLAGLMARIGEARGRTVRTVLSDMEVPLGRTIGNLIEVREIASLLENPIAAEPRLCRLVKRLAAEGFVAAGMVETVAAGEELAARQVTSGAALAKLKQVLSAQGGDVSCLDQPHRTAARRDIRAKRPGWIAALPAGVIGAAAMRLGAGRRTKDDLIDPTAGIEIAVAFGQAVDQGQLLATVYASTDATAEVGAAEIADAIAVGDSAPQELPLFRE